jgi:hypothetical protein
MPQRGRTIAVPLPSHPAPQLENLGNSSHPSGSCTQKAKSGDPREPRAELAKRSLSATATCRARGLPRSHHKIFFCQKGST